VPENRIYLEQLAPDQALNLLDEAVNEGMGSWLAEITLEVTQSAFGHTVSLVVPESPASHNVKQVKLARHNLSRLVSLYHSLSGAEPRRAEARPGGLALAEGLVWLLLNSEPGDQRFTADNRTELLLVAHDLSAEDAASLFEDLRFHATHTRLATANDQTGDIWVFHLRDDPQRHSSLASLVAAGTMGNRPLLICHQVDQRKIFLPESCQASEVALGFFCRILVGVPELLKLIGEPPESGMFVAIDPRTSGADTVEYQILYLARLSFLSQSLLAPAPGPQAQIQVHHLADSKEALAKLRHALARVEPAIGYKLELRHTTYKEPVELERSRLLERQAELDYRIAYLNSISEPRPQLLRFTQQQLPALADVVRAFPVKVLREGFPKYGYQSHPRTTGARTEGEAVAGYHYVLIEPEDAVFAEMDPLLLWERLDDKPMRFHLDPFWARYYHGQGNSCLIFVPQGAALFPTMHGWDVDSMDTYMRETMSAWFAGRGQSVKIPRRPIFIFEGQSEAKAPIKITVLDRDSLAPLRTRLGWINDHLSVADTVGLEKFVHAMSTDTGRLEMARRLKGEAQESQHEFDRMVQETNRQIASRLDELTTVVTEEFNHLVAETHQTTVKIKEYYDYLEQLTVLCDASKKSADLAYSTLNDTEEHQEEVSDYLVKLEQRVERELANAYKVRRAMKGRVERTIRELGTTHEELKQQLKDALRIGNR